MAICDICGKNIGFLEKYQLLLRGAQCCYPCWEKYTDSPHEVGVAAVSKDELLNRKYIIDNTPQAKKRISDNYKLQVQKCTAGCHVSSWANIGDYMLAVSTSGRTLCIIESEQHHMSTYDFNRILQYSPLSEIEPYRKFRLQEVEHYIIRIDDIECYAKEGDVKYTTEISGGGGGGSNIAGAVLGGIVAGGAGAIIASRQPIEAITSTTTEHDSRKTVLRYYKNGKLCSFISQGFELYDYLFKNIPHKDLLAVQLQKNTPPSNANKTNSSPEKPTSVPKKPTTVPERPKTTPNGVTEIRTRLQSLKVLYEDGLIDETEYKEKKKELLQQL